MRAIVIMFDTLSREFLPHYGNDWIKAPNFERLIDRTVTFENFYGGSMPCMPARRELHTGRYNFLHRMWGPLEVFDHSVFEKLQNNGIYCHLITDHSHYFEDGGATYHNRYSSWEGFRGQEGDRWVPRKDIDIPENYNENNKTGISVNQHFANRTRQMVEEEMSSVKVIDEGLRFLQQYKDKDDWFVQIECFDPHEPFYVPDNYRKKYQKLVMDSPYFWPRYGKVPEGLTSEDLDNLKKEYAALLSMCDFHLGRILDFLDNNNMWEDTLIIFNTDHGLLFGEHDWLGKNIPPMYNQVVHLPFFISYPDEKVGYSTKRLAQTIDIPATLLDYFNIENDLDMDGESLLDILKNDEDIHKEIIFGTNGGHVGIYDGRYIYMRASVSPDNSPLHIQTTAYTLMRGFIDKKYLENMILHSGNRFTNGYPYTEIEVDNYIDSYSTGNLLFDMSTDEKQMNNIKDEKIENYMIHKLVTIMKKIKETAKGSFCEISGSIKK